MSIYAASLIMNALATYAALGLVVGVAFLLFGIDRMDSGARGAIAFRPLLLPGLALLWPLVAWRWWRFARAGH